MSACSRRRWAGATRLNLWPTPSLGYGKGAMVLQLLENEIGSDMITRAMHEWLRTNPPRHVGSWEDFERVVNRVTGKNLSWFFDQWVRRKGLPNFTLADVKWEAGRLSGRLAFTGDRYRIHSELRIEFSDGVSKTVSVETGDDGIFSTACEQRPAATGERSYRGAVFALRLSPLWSPRAAPC